MKRGVLTAWVLVLLTGCAATSYNELKDNYSVKESFVIERNYQAVYRDVLAGAREQHQTNLISGSINVNGQLYTDIKTGEIEIYLSGMVGNSVYAGVEITALSDNQTKVVSYATYQTWSDFPDLVKQWATPPE